METTVVSQETVSQADHVGRIVAQWQEQRPDLDPTPLLVIARIARLAHRTDALLRPPFARVGLTSGDFDILAALRRSGPPYVLRHRDLAAQTLVSPGAITKRIDRLASQGFVTRSPHVSDARGQDVGLTDEGIQFTDQMIEQHLSNEADIVRAISHQDRSDLARMLAKLLAELESRPGFGQNLRHS
jgi:DNA-binding MarR family transcriptional regulator